MDATFFHSILSWQYKPNLLLHMLWCQIGTRVSATAGLAKISDLNNSNVAYNREFSWHFLIVCVACRIWRKPGALLIQGWVSFSIQETQGMSCKLRWNLWFYLSLYRSRRSWGRCWLRHYRNKFHSGLLDIFFLNLHYIYTGYGSLLMPQQI